MEACLARINEILGEKRNLDVGATSLCNNAIGEGRHNKVGLSVSQSFKLPTADCQQGL